MGCGCEGLARAWALGVGCGRVSAGLADSRLPLLSDGESMIGHVGHALMIRRLWEV